MQKRCLYFGMAVLTFCVLGGLSPLASHAQWVAEGQAPEGKWTAGFRAGFSILTQQMIPNTSSSIGPALNFQGLYGVNKWLNVGLMLEWEHRSVDLERPKMDMGSLNTVSLLPMVEFRPGRFGRLIPYASAGIGVNVNSFSEDDTFKRNVGKVDTTNTFAFRLASGVDYPINPHVALNTEIAWKRNRSGVDIGGANTSFDASSFNFLFGARYTF
jgi:outer membrane protein